jgi:hypothetical protein
MFQVSLEHKTLSEKQLKQNMTEGVAQSGKYLPNKLRAPSSNLIITKTMKIKKETIQSLTSQGTYNLYGKNN